jgi:uncharacterized membrane protein (UPF0182 family)
MRWLIAPILLVLLIPAGLGLWLDHQFFVSQGFEQVFLLRLQTQLLLGTLGGVVAGLVTYANIRLATAQVARAVGKEPPPEIRVVFRIVVPVSIVVGMVFGIAASGHWNSLLTFGAQVPFGIAVPQFDHDVAFYVWSLPAFGVLHTWLVWVVLVATAVTALVYAVGVATVSSLMRSSATHDYLPIEYRRHPLAIPVVRHLATLGSLLLVLAAISYWFQNNQLVYSARGVVLGASATDVEIVRPANTVLMIVTFGLAIGLLALGVRSRSVLSPRYLAAVAAAPLLWAALAFLLGVVLPGAYEQFMVVPQQLAKERPYIEQNNALTRQAWDLDRVQYADLAGDAAIRPETLVQNADTLHAVRIADYRPLLDTYRQIQRIRQYYDFVDVDIDRYGLQAGLQQVMLAPRELDTAALPQVARTWQNLHLVYTHGYGVVASPVNRTTVQGLPELLVRDIPPVATDPAFQIDRPQIYFGDQANGYVIVGSRLDEFDRPGDSTTPEIKARYAGGGTIPVGGGLRRLALAAAMGDVNILISGDVTADSGLLVHREIRERVQHIAPFLRLDRDPYMVVLDGRVQWVQDAYTATDKFPDAARHQDLNYMRNSVKVTVDAYDGSMRFYALLPDEPILQVFRRLYPAMFLPLDQAPAGLTAHFRYPEDLFNAQAAMLAAYHMTDPQTFYNREDLWAIAQESYGNTVQQMGAYFTILRLPNEAREEFATILPFTPGGQDRNNMVAWMVARSDPDHYGQLRVYRFPQGKLVFGPQQVEARINQEPAISSQLTLWSQQGSRVIRGNLLVIPLQDAVLYVQPLYIQSERSPLPELKRVIVASTQGVVMSDQLETGLQALAQGRRGEVLAAPSAAIAAPGPLATGTEASLAQRARQHLRAAQEAAGRGDWATYGTELAALAQVLEQLDSP